MVILKFYFKQFKIILVCTVKKYVSTCKSEIENFEETSVNIS